MMSLDEASTVANRCYKIIGEQQPIDNLNIEFNFPNSMIILWNKYQIFIYQDFNFKSPARVLTPEYQIHSLLITNKFILCVDINNFVHITSLKFKNPDQRIFRCSYQPRGEGIRACVRYSENEFLSLKYDSETYFLCLNKINSDFPEVKKVALCYRNSWSLQDSSKDKCFLAHRKIDDPIFQRNVNTDKLRRNCHLIVMSFDMHTVFIAIFEPYTSPEHLDLLKLYTCPSEINSIELIGTKSIIIGLKMGTVLRLSPKDLFTCDEPLEPEVVHLNSALHKLLVMNDTFLYTDGVSMWHAENIFAKNIIFKQLFVRNVNDFIRCGDRIICTTFAKLIYTFLFANDESYLDLVNKGYSSVELLLDNSEYLHKIFEEVEKGKKLSKILSIEGSYIAAMSLSNRQEIMHKIIATTVTVCGTFEEILRENIEELTLTEDISQYYGSEVYLLLLKVKMNSESQVELFDILSDIMANSDTELQVSLSHEQKLIKSLSLKMSKKNFLIPLILEHSEIDVDICLVSRIPGTYDNTQKIWTELYKQTINLTCEHFLQAYFQKSLISLKLNEDLDKSIQLTSNESSDEFEFINVCKRPVSVMYIRLPKKFELCKIAEHFNSSKSQFMVELLRSNEFMKSEGEIGFMVGKEAVTLELDNDGFSEPRLKVKSENLRVTQNIRDFFADIVYAQNACKPEEEFINNSYYTTVENLQKSVKDYITTSVSFEDFAPLMEKFEKEVIAALPV